MYRLVSFCFLLAMWTAANAQSNTSSISAPLHGQPNHKKKLSVVAIVATSTNLEEAGSATDSSGTSIEIRPSYRISSISTVRADIAAEMDHNTEESKLLNTRLVLARDAIKLNNDDTLALAGQVFLPTDKDARQKATFLGGMGATGTYRHKLKLLGKESAVSYGINALKNVHEFSRDNNRAANLSHRVRQVAGVEMGLYKKLSLDISGYFQTGWTYDNVLKESFNSSQSLVYSIDSRFSISLDHTLQGRAFEADGSEWNVDLYDSRKSEVGISLVGIF